MSHRGRERTEARLREVPSVLRDTAIRLHEPPHRARSASGGSEAASGAAEGASPPLDVSPSLHTAYSGSRSRSRGADAVSATAATSPRGARDSSPSPSPPTRTAADLPMNLRGPPISDTTRAAAVDGILAKLRHSAERLTSGARAESWPGQQRGDSHSHDASVLRRAARARQQQQQQQRQRSTSASTSPPPASSATSSLSRPLQRLLRTDGANHATGRAAGLGSRSWEGETRVGQLSLSPLTPSENDKAGERTPRVVPPPPSAPATSRRREPHPSSHISAEKDTIARDPYAWQQHVIDARLRLRDSTGEAKTNEQGHTHTHQTNSRRFHGDDDRHRAGGGGGGGGGGDRVHTIAAASHDANESDVESDTDRDGHRGDDVVARTADLLAHYGATVRIAEEDSLQRLAGHLQRVEAEWAARAEAFEEAKAELEESLLARLVEALQQQQQQKKGQGTAESAAVEAARWKSLIEEHVAKAWDAVRARERDAESDLERRVVQQVSAFTAEYKSTLDADYAERCRRLDERVAERDRKWVAMLAEERKRLERAEAEAEAGGRRQQDLVIGAVGEAMQEVAALREQVVRDAEAQQTRLMSAFTEKRAELIKRGEEERRRQAAQVEEVQRGCAKALLASQTELDALQAELAARDVELARLRAALERAQASSPTAGPGVNGDTMAFTERCARLREEVAQHWRALMDEQAAEHTSMRRALAGEYEARVEELRAEQQRRLAELAVSYQEQVAEVRRTADAAWVTEREAHQQQAKAQAARLAEGDRTRAELAEQVRALQLKVEEVREAGEARVARVTAGADATWRAKLHASRERYEQLLATAAQRQQRAVPGEEHERVCAELQAAKLRVVELTAATETAVEAERARASAAALDEREALARTHREAMSALREELASERAGWHDALREKEAAWHAQTQDSIARLRELMGRQLAHERASAQTLVRGAHAAAEGRHEAFAQEMERAWRERYAAFEADVAARERDLAARADALRSREAALRAELLRAGAAELEEQRTVLYAQLAQDQAAVAAAREALAEERRRMTLQLERTVEERLFAAKQQLRGQQAAVVGHVLAFAEQREGVLLAAREAELGLLAEHYEASLRELARRQYVLRDSVKAEVRAMLDRTATMLEVQKSALVASVGGLQEDLTAEREAAYRDMLDAHLAEVRRVMVERANDVGEHWLSMEAYVQRYTAGLEEQRRELEAGLRASCERALEAERARSQEALDALRTEHAGALAEAAQRHTAHTEERLRALASRHEALAQDLRDSLERAAHEHRAELQRQRDALGKEAAARLAAAVERHEAQMSELRAACESRVAQAAEKEVELRGRLAGDLVAVEKRYAATGEAARRELQARFQEQLATLRAELQARDERIARMEVARAAEVRAAVEAAVAEMQQRYEAFTRQVQVTQRAPAPSLDSEVEERVGSGTRHEGLEKISPTPQLPPPLPPQPHQLLPPPRDALYAGGGTPTSSGRVSAHDPAMMLATPFGAHTGREPVPAPPPPLLRRPSFVTASPMAPPLPVALRGHAPTTTTTLPPSLWSSSASLPPLSSPRPVLAERSVNAHALRSPVSSAQKPLATTITALSASLSTFLAKQPAWGRLGELWAVLETSAEEQQHVAERLTVAWSRAPDGGAAEAAARAVLAREVERREGQLPLLEVYARVQSLREQQQQQQQQQQEGHEGGSGGDGGDSANAEVAHLIQYLRRAIPQHEKHYGQTFVFRGARVMDQLF